jgi:predicted metal-dependent enzyme (double-stranded beta helix superfamily)
MSFDTDTFVADCLAARAETDPRRAVKEVLERAVSDPSAIAGALPPDRAEIEALHVSDELTILKVVWAPDMRIRPHDHRMWAAIGIYSGGEDNDFFRRSESGLASSGGRRLAPGDTVLLGDDTIHSVHNPTAQHAGAIHIYNGDFFATPRSEWDEATLEEQPYDMERTLRSFEEHNRVV